MTLAFVLLFSISPRVACRANFPAVSRVLPIVLKSQYSRFHHGSNVARISVWSRVLPLVFVPKKNIVVLTFRVVIHFSGESASLLVEKRQDGSEPHAINDEANERAVEEKESRQLKSNHVSLLERNERQFYDNLLVSRNDSLSTTPARFWHQFCQSLHITILHPVRSKMHQSTVPNPLAFHRKARF